MYKPRAIYLNGFTLYTTKTWYGEDNGVIYLTDIIFPDGGNYITMGISKNPKGARRDRRRAKKRLQLEVARYLQEKINYHMKRIDSYKQDLAQIA